jgi:hypothetical protein
MVRFTSVWFEVKKGSLFIDEWEDITETLERHTDKLIDRDAVEANDYPPIVAREDPERPGFYRVWDGQLRTVSALHNNAEAVMAYVYPNIG